MKNIVDTVTAVVAAATATATATATAAGEGRVITVIGMRGVTFISFDFWIRFRQLNFYEKFPHFFGGEN